MEWSFNRRCPLESSNTHDVNIILYSAGWAFYHIEVSWRCWSASSWSCLDLDSTLLGMCSIMGCTVHPITVAACSLWSHPRIAGVADTSQPTSLKMTDAWYGLMNDFYDSSLIYKTIFDSTVNSGYWQYIVKHSRKFSLFFLSERKWKSKLILYAKCTFGRAITICGWSTQGSIY